jgi:hypothetical protein
VPKGSKDSRALRRAFRTTSKEQGYTQESFAGKAGVDLRRYRQAATGISLGCASYADKSPRSAFIKRRRAQATSAGVLPGGRRGAWRRPVIAWRRVQGSRQEQAIIAHRLGVSARELIDGLQAPVCRVGTAQVLDLITRRPGITADTLATSLGLPSSYSFEIALYLQSTGAIASRRTGWHPVVETPAAVEIR